MRRHYNHDSSDKRKDLTGDLNTISEAWSIIIMMGNMAAGMAAVVLEKELRTTS